jgi:hypothetical protein
MPPGRRRFIEMFIVCWLMVMAGGDDFSVSRIAILFPFSNSQHHPLPLDDSDTDLPTSDESQSVREVRSLVEADSAIVDHLPVNRPFIAPLLLFFRAHSPHSHRFSLLDLSVRLRC